MKSKGDPILDLQEICNQNPTDKAALEKAYNELGWEVPFEEVLSAAMDIYLTQSDDGLYYPRNGNALEIINKILGARQ